MNSPKKHHYVPQCYLNNFRPSKGCPLFVLNFENVKRGYKTQIRPVHPASICYKENFYSIDRTLVLNGGIRPENYIEIKVNGYYENILPELISKIIKNSVLSLEDANLFSDFIIHLKVRNPYQLLLNENSKLQKITEVAEKRYNSLKEKALKNGYSESIFDLFFQKTVNSFIDNNNLIEDFQRESLIQKFENPIEKSKKFRDAILSSSWVLLEIEKQGEFFITTDNPGVAIDNFGVIHNTKFANGFKFFFPLSPTHSLMITDVQPRNFEGSGISIQREIVNSNTIKNINILSSKVSNKLLISNSLEVLKEFLQ